jgi:hypothetical protein
MAVGGRPAEGRSSSRDVDYRDGGSWPEHGSPAAEIVRIKADHCGLAVAGRGKRSTARIMWWRGGATRVLGDTGRGIQAEGHQRHARAGEVQAPRDLENKTSALLQVKMNSPGVDLINLLSLQLFSFYLIPITSHICWYRCVFRVPTSCSIEIQQCFWPLCAT